MEQIVVSFGNIPTIWVDTPPIIKRSNTAFEKMEKSDF